MRLGRRPKAAARNSASCAPAGVPAPRPARSATRSDGPAPRPARATPHTTAPTQTPHMISTPAERDHAPTRRKITRSGPEWLRRRSHDPAGTHTTWVQTGPPIRVPTRAGPAPGGNGPLTRECRADDVFHWPSVHTRAGPAPDPTGDRVVHPHRHLRPGPRRQRHLPIDSGGPAPSVALRHLPHADQRVRP